MAVVQLTPVSPPEGSRDIRYWLWEGLDGNSTGYPVFVGEHTDLSVQFGAAGGNTDNSSTTVLQGSLDVAADPAHPNHASAVWINLKDALGDTVQRTTSAAGFQVLLTPMWVRPYQSGGSGANIDVMIKAVRR